MARGSNGAEPPRERSSSESAALIRDLIRQRRLRADFFPSDLFADPAWDILLDLAAARHEGTKVSVSSLCIAANVPTTTALRWIKALGDAGLLERQPDPGDGRRSFIALTERTAALMERYLDVAS
jgi:DNA-binding MarR family transcriptional regulator